MIQILEYKKNMQKEVKDFVIETMKGELQVDNPKTFQKITKDLNNIQANYIDNGGVFLVAYDDFSQKIIGTIAFTFENDLAILKRFYVAKEKRKKKIGFLLYKTLEEIVKLKKIEKLYLVSGKELNYAFNFYTRNGWNIEVNNPGIFVRNNANLYQKSFNLKKNTDDNFKIEDKIDKIIKKYNLENYIMERIGPFKKFKTMNYLIEFLGSCI